MKGPERLTVGELFKKIAIGEMKRAEFLAEKIVALGGVPLRWLLLAVLAGRGPSLIAANWLGTRATTSSLPLFGGMLVLLVAAAFIMHRS